MIHLWESFEQKEDKEAEEKWTPIMRAIMSGKIEEVETILEKITVGELNEPETMFGQTCLHLVSSNRFKNKPTADYRLRVSELLLEKAPNNFAIKTANIRCIRLQEKATPHS